MAHSPQTVIQPSVIARPEWLKVRATLGENYRQLKGLLRGLSLHSVCEEALCPNIYECFEMRTATFLILGDVCTRRCSFCAIANGHPRGLLAGGRRGPGVGPSPNRRDLRGPR